MQKKSHPLSLALNPDQPETRLERALDHVAHLLPAQGPISVFIHHNTLHAFEDLPFERAVVLAGELFGCEPGYQGSDQPRVMVRTWGLRAFQISGARSP